MRIAFVLPNYPTHPTGGGRVVYQYANGLADRGHTVTVVHPRWTWANRPEPRENVRLLSAAWRFVLGWRDSHRPPTVGWQVISPRVRCVFLRGEPRPAVLPDGDALIGYTWYTGPHVAACPPSKGTKFQYVGDYEQWAFADDKQRQRMRTGYQVPVIKLAMSRASAAMAADGVRDAMPSHVVPLAIDHDVYHVTRPIAERARPVVAMPYRTLVYKGAADGLEAARLVKQQVPDLRLILFGSLPLQHELDPWMTYVYQPSNAEVVEIYNQSAVFMVPSWAEGWGLPGMEAMACGTALCSTDTGGVHEYAEHGRTALISPPRRPELLAANIVSLLTDDDARIRLARAGVEAVQAFTWDRAVDVFEGHLVHYVGLAREQSAGEAVALPR